MEIVSTIALISINATLLVQLASFLLFLLIINRVMFRPLHNTMRERDFFIENLGLDIQSAQADAERTLADLAAQERAVRREADALRRRRRAQGADDAQKILDEARQRIVALHSEAEADVHRQLTEARRRLPAEAEKLTLTLMEKILERRVGS
jgi:F-type H+-transporting ATPase subunit b